MGAILYAGDRLRLVALKVGGGLRDYLWAIVQQADRLITRRAQESTNRASRVIVIQRESALAARWRGAACAFANGAHTALRREHSVIFMRLYAEFLSSVAVRRQPRRLFSVRLPPGRLSISTAGPAKALQTIHLSFVVREVSEWLHGLARPTPLHAWRDLRPSLSKSVMTTQVRERLASNPPQVRAVSLCNRGGPSTPTLAIAFRDSSLHVFSY